LRLGIKRFTIRTSWGRCSWTLLGGGSTHFAVFQNRVSKRKLGPNKCLKTLYFLKAVKITSALGGTASNLRRQSSTVGSAHRSPRGSHTNYYKLFQRCSSAELGVKNTLWELEHIFHQGGRG